MAEKWILLNQAEGYNKQFFDEESIKDNKDGTYSLAIKYAVNEGVKLRRNEIGSFMSKVIISCSPFKALSMDTNAYNSKDFTGSIIKNHDGQDWTQGMIDTEIQKKTCGNNNAALTPAPTTIPTPSTKVSIDDAKAQCSDIGFKAGTEKFGDCVLELMQ